MFERFTDRSRRVVILAQDYARVRQHTTIGPEHLVLGLFEADGLAAQVLAERGVTEEAYAFKMDTELPAGEHPVTGHIPFTRAAKRVLELALREALQLGHNYIGTEHLLLGLVRQAEECPLDAPDVALGILRSLGGDVTLVALRQDVILKLTGYQPQVVQPEPAPALDPELLTPAEKKALELTAELAGLFCQIVGRGRTREHDMDELIIPLHVIQRYILSQAAGRAYTGEYRLLGESLQS